MAFSSLRSMDTIFPLRHSEMTFVNTIEKNFNAEWNTTCAYCMFYGSCMWTSIPRSECCHTKGNQLARTSLYGKDLSLFFFESSHKSTLSKIIVIKPHFNRFLGTCRKAWFCSHWFIPFNITVDMNSDISNHYLVCVTCVPQATPS